MPDSTTIHGDGTAPNILSDVRDVGHYVARIIADPRTLIKSVYAWSDVLTENQIFAIVEEISGEKVERKNVREKYLISLLRVQNALIEQLNMYIDIGRAS